MKEWFRARMVRPSDSVSNRSPASIRPTRKRELLSGIQGELWIDQAQERMVRLDAHLFEDVDFGWGILGRLYKGGSIRIENADVGNHNWQLQRMKLDLTGKALMLKTLTFRITENGTGYELVPREMSYKDGIRLLQSKAPTAGRGGWAVTLLRHQFQSANLFLADREFLDQVRSHFKSSPS